MIRAGNSVRVLPGLKRAGVPYFDLLLSPHPDARRH